MTTTLAPPPAPRVAEPAPPRKDRRRLFQAKPGQPKWERPALFALLALTALLYLWNLSASGWGNDFYAAAVQSGTKDWTAFLFGSLDPNNVITVDKPPASLWAMALSGRIFGFSSWSMLAPQALMGVASVALLYAAVKRHSGAAAGLLAGAALALTPVATLMFKFNNPDAMLTLLLVAGAYCMVRALEHASTKWIALAGAAVGFAFLAKLAQAFLVLPAFILVFLIAAPTGWWKRIGKLLVALATMIVSAGWLIALEAVWPGDKPYIGGSTNNSLLQLALGYNGLGRIFGGDGNPSGNGGGPGGGGGNSMFGGSTGITRMFGDSFGTEISWLLPAALIGLLAGLWFTRRAPRTDKVRAGLILWGGWTLGTGLTFSYMSGIIHPYYTVALAPGIAGLIGITVVQLWKAREYRSTRVILAVMLAGTGTWNYILLDRTSEWLPWLRWTILVGSILAAAMIAVGTPGLKRTTAAVAIAGLLFGLGGSAAYSIETSLHAHNGSIPTAGPNSGGMGGPGGMRPGGNTDGHGTDGRNSDGQNTDGRNADSGNTGSGRAANSTDATSIPSGTDATGTPGGQGGPGGFGGSNSELQTLIKNAGNYTWAAAAIGSQTAAGLELNTGASVMSIGGFTGSDNAPTLAQFQQWVSEGKIHYFIGGGGHGPGGDNTTSSAGQISAWVSAHFKSSTVGSTTVYDLTAPAS